FPAIGSATSSWAETSRLTASQSSMVTVRPGSPPSPAGTSMYRRRVAPPGAGRYSTPSSSSPNDSTVGASNWTISLVFSLIFGGNSNAVWRDAACRPHKRQEALAGLLCSRALSGFSSDGAGIGATAGTCAVASPVLRIPQPWTPRNTAQPRNMVAGAGFQPATFGL